MVKISSNICITGSLWEITDHRWFPADRVSNAESVFRSWRPHDIHQQGGALNLAFFLKTFDKRGILKVNRLSYSYDLYIHYQPYWNVLIFKSILFISPLVIVSVKFMKRKHLYDTNIFPKRPEWEPMHYPSPCHRSSCGSKLYHFLYSTCQKSASRSLCVIWLSPFIVVLVRNTLLVEHRFNAPFFVVVKSLSLIEFVWLVNPLSSGLLQGHRGYPG